MIVMRFTNQEDKDWMENTMKQVVRNHVGEHMMADAATEPYFVDFLQDAPEPTGEEPEDADMDAPKIYELVMIFS